MSSIWASSMHVLGATLPPYWMRMCLDTTGETAAVSQLRMPLCTSCACAGVATRPVPMAHTGS